MHFLSPLGRTTLHINSTSLSIQIFYLLILSLRCRKLKVKKSMDGFSWMPQILFHQLLWIILVSQYCWVLCSFCVPDHYSPSDWNTYPQSQKRFWTTFLTRPALFMGIFNHTCVCVCVCTGTCLCAYIPAVKGHGNTCGTSMLLLR